MVAVVAGDSAQSAMASGGTANGKLEEPDHSSSNWYFSRDDIEKRSPSRLDGIDLKKETYFRKSYCTFLQDLGMCLKVPQVTIATAIVFSHRFFLRQSHLKNDRHLIATICMFLAGKVEETPRPLRDVILMSYEIRHKKDPGAVARIKQKEVYEEQKELVLVGERLVLTTLGFDLNILHPYKPLVAAIKKLKVAQNALAQVAWNFVNDGLRTSLCLQFKPHHIAAGAIFLAAKFLKVKLPQDGDKVWWQEFEVTPRQLEEVSNQMLELYEQNKTFGSAAPSGSRSCDPGSSVVTVSRAKGQDSAVPSANGTHWNQPPLNPVGADKSYKHAQTVKADDAVTSTRREEAYEISAIHAPPVYDVQENGHAATDYEPAHANGYVAVPAEASAETSGTGKSSLNGQVKYVAKLEVREHLSCAVEDGQIKEEVQENKDLKMLSAKVKVENEDEEPKRLRSTNIEDVNTDRVKALAQKRRQSKGEAGDAKLVAAKQEMEVTDEEELLERELESGVEAAAEAEKVKQERRDAKVKPSQKMELDVLGVNRDGADEGDARSKRRKVVDEDVNEKKRTKSSERGERVDWADGDGERGRPGADRAEDGELPSSSHAHDQPRSPRSLDRKPVPPGSHDKNTNASSSKRHRDLHGRRDGHRDARVAHGSRDRDYYQRDYHHQYRADGERDRHHYKERDYQDRDHKKLRPHELHGS